MKTRRDVFQAIADPTRRAILTMLAAGSLTPGAIAGAFGSSRQTISKHIQILTECGLLVQELSGREINYHLNPKKIDEIEYWLNELRQILEQRFNNLERYLESIQKNQQKQHR